MENKFAKPKRASEILDHTFNLSKNHFKDFFLILLIFMGPVYLLEAIIQLSSGTSFFRAVGSGNSRFEQILSSFTENGTIDTSNSLVPDVGVILVSLIGFLLLPVAEAAILIMINHIRKNEEFTIGKMIKQAFSRFWGILGSNLLFGLITFFLFFIPFMIIVFITMYVIDYNIVIGVLLAIFLSLGTLLGIGLLLTRWSFYFGSVVVDRESPGLTRSWRLTKKRTWKLLGLYIVFYLIMSVINSTIQMSFGIALGSSVLFSIITNMISLITTLFFAVGYAVMFFDAKTRHDAEDLKELIADYENMNEQV